MDNQIDATRMAPPLMAAPVKTGAGPAVRLDRKWSIRAVKRDSAENNESTEHNEPTDNNGTTLAQLEEGASCIRAMAQYQGRTPIPSDPSTFPSVAANVMAWATTHPTSPAVRTADGQSHIYAELAGDAWALADALTAHDVGPGCTVALLVDRSYVTVVALMGTWLVGAAYVAVDTAYPESRIAYIIEDCGASVLVTGGIGCGGGNGHVPGNWTGAIVNLAGGKLEGTSPSPCSDQRAPLPIAPDSLACIFYTSGTSGRPKILELYADAAPEALSHMRLLQFAGERIRVDAVVELVRAAQPGMQLQVR
ncbi:hypothetical protein FOA52_003022 [Chlamydomonas sp. UWO 241]|nr:hypothetical protein FOA52_003022 [Chlamydomonas sp. UWO 241]